MVLKTEFLQLFLMISLGSWRHIVTDESSIKTTCTTVNFRQSSNQPVYLQNRDYADSTCECSVEVYSFETIDMVGMQLESSASQHCSENMTISDEKNNNLWNFTSSSESEGSIDIKTITLPSTYVVFRHTQTPITSVCVNFTLGFQAVERGANMSVSCPPKPPTDCGRHGNVSYGNVTFFGSKYGSTATYMCIKGYHVTSGDAHRTCLENGIWNGTEPVCAAVDCGILVAIDNGDVSSNGTVYDSVATYTCHAGYIITGYEVRTCAANGNWSDTPPSCQIKDCGTLVEPSNSTITYTGTSTTFNSVATHTCVTGYLLTSGSRTRTCQANGTWDGAQPSCTQIDCSPPVSPENSEVVHPYRTTYHQSVTFHCLDGYTLSGGDSLECLKNGSWSKPLGRCEKSVTVAPWVYYAVIPAGGVLIILVIIVMCYVRNKRRSDEYKAEKAREK